MAMNPRLLRPLATFDPDAAAYLRAVEAADGQALETPVKRAVDDFFRGIKADNTFGAIKAACLLCGARTLAGALVPLVGTAPTNGANGFVAGDYTRGGATPGLKGDGASYLDSGRATDADSQNDNHWAIYITTPQTVAGRSAFGSGDNVAVSYNYHRTNTAVGKVGEPQLQNNTSTNYNTTNGLEAAGLSATSRSSASQYDWVSGGSSGVVSASSVAPNSLNSYVFAANTETGAAIFSNARLAFYSIGESISDLAALDARVTALVTAIGAAV